ncbi:MAG: PilW family protein [Polaromonas sp.]
MIEHQEFLSMIHPVKPNDTMTTFQISIHKHARQRGVTLIELMVGITIGLLTVAVAIGTLAVSRSVSGTITEASQLQQQAAYAFRVIGQQIRQAGSVRLNLAFSKADTDLIDASDTVAFEKIFDGTLNTIIGKETPGTDEYKLSVGYQNYTESLFPSGAVKSQLKDCLAEQPSANIIQSNLVLIKALGASSGELRCAGSDNAAQAIVSKVADLQIRYLLQSNAAISSPTIQYVSAAGVANWPSVFGIEVCIEFVGDETIDTAGATYRDCSWTAGNAEKNRGNKLRMVFRNTYQLRSQGSFT